MPAPSYANPVGFEPRGPGDRSPISTVPAPAVLLRQGSRPDAVVAAEKTTEPPTAVRPTGLDPVGPGSMSATIEVPPVVPSVDQSSEPATWSLAEK